MIWKNHSFSKSKPITQYELKIKEKNPMLSVNSDELDNNIKEATRFLKNNYKHKNKKQ